MERVYNHTLIIIAIILTCSPMLLQSQNTRHYVEKGETVYQIARKYNVSPKKILMLNPNASDLIQIGQELVIPEPQFKALNAASNNGEYEIYTVIAGDTKFKLSQKFGISINDLEQLNPQMVPTLLADSQIRIPVSTTVSTSQNTENLKKHLVVKGETLYGIARMYGITLEQLIDANADRLGKVLLAGQYLEIPQLKSSSQNVSGETYVVQKGDTKYGLSKRFNVDISTLEQVNPSIVPTLMAGDRIIIPDDNIDSAPPVVNSNKDPDPQEPDVDEKPIVTTKTPDDELERTAENTPVANKNVDNTAVDYSSIKPEQVEILLSFTENEYNKFIATAHLLPKSNTPLTAQQEEMLNYKGIVKAIDSLRGMNYNLPVNTRFAVNDSLMINKELYSDNQLFLAPNLDLILDRVGNISDRSILVTNSYRDNNRTLNSPVFISRNQSNSSKDFLLRHLDVPGNNLIMVSDPTQLDYIASAKAQNSELQFLTETNSSRIDQDQIQRLLSKNKKNYIIFNTDRSGVFINVTNSLLKLSATYNIQTAIVNESFLPKGEDVSNTRFKILKMIYPKSLYKQIDESVIKDSTTSQRLVNQGYNTAYDLIRKLRNYSTNGGDVITVLKGNRMEQLQYFESASNRFRTGNFEIRQY